MRRRYRARIAISAWCVLGLLTVAGCGSPELAHLFGHSPSGSGPQSAQLTRADNVEASPCALLSSVQVRQLGLNPGQLQPATDGWGAVECLWTSIAAHWGGNYVGRVLSGPVPGGSPAASINGLPTAEYTPAGLDPNYYCAYLVTLPSGETLWAQYGSPNGNQPGINHRVACHNAQTAAADMASTFNSLR